ncbi:MAG: hypothetical protein Kow00106_01160 [Anaerolineae bacterium]
MITHTLTHETLEILCSQSPVATIVVDADKRIRLLNPAAEKALGVPPLGAVGHALADYEALQAVAEQMDTTPNGPGIQTTVLKPGDGTEVAVQIIVALDTSAVSLSQVELVENLVHDLKRPAAVAKSLADMVQETGALNEQQLAWLDRARRKLLTMSSTINEVIDTFWMEVSGELLWQEADLVPIIQRLVREAGDLALLNGVVLETDLPEEGCPIQVDATRIQGAISNLINNAIKYSPDGGVVHISLTDKGDAITFQVTDQGIGIPPEELERIFEPGYRVRSKETERIEGTGIGLAIVRTVVDKHGGKVFVHSIPGQGSTFGFTLPRKS